MPKSWKNFPLAKLIKVNEFFFKNRIAFICVKKAPGENGLELRRVSFA